MRDLNYDLKELCRRNRDGSFNTQADRARILDKMATQLYELGFRDMRATSLKPKHVAALLNQWRAEGLSAGTIKNRMSALRWWADKVGKQGVIARDNARYEIPNRQYVTNASKARELTPDDLAKVTDPYSAASLKLQAAFGLRRAESIKIQPAWADRGDKLAIKASWAKGGRARIVPIRTEAQRQALAEAKALARKGSLIPKDKRYVDQLQRFKHQCAKAGIYRVHGHRHAYAQARYLDLTGRTAPAAGGLRSRQLTPEQKAIDREARLEISRELGHEREQITAAYVGR